MVNAKRVRRINYRPSTFSIRDSRPFHLLCVLKMRNREHSVRSASSGHRDHDNADFEFQRCPCGQIAETASEYRRSSSRDRVAFNETFIQDQGHSLRDRRAEGEPRKKRRSRKEEANRSSGASDLKAGITISAIGRAKKVEINYAISKKKVQASTNFISFWTNLYCHAYCS